MPPAVPVGSAFKAARSSADAGENETVTISVAPNDVLDLGGRLGNVVMQSSADGKVLKGFRLLQIDGEDVGSTETEVAAALQVARKKGKFKAKFAGFKATGGGGMMLAAVGKAVVKGSALKAAAEKAAAEKAAAEKAAAEKAAAEKATAAKAAAAKAAAAKAEADTKAAADVKAAADAKVAADAKAAAEAKAAADAKAAAEAKADTAAAGKAAAGVAAAEKADRAAAAAKAAAEKAAAAAEKAAAEKAQIEQQAQLKAAWERSVAMANSAPAPRPGAFTALPSRASVAEPQQTLLQSLNTRWVAADDDVDDEEEGSGPCDKCDGPHPTSKCPHFKKSRDKHKDAWDGYGSEGGNGKGCGGGKDSPSPPPTLRGARVVRQPGDGSCLFHSLAHGLRGKSTPVACGSADAVRDAVAGFIEAQPEAEIGGTPLREWIRWESGGDVRAYCKRMRGDGEWGGAIEIAVFSRLVGASVHVFERDPKAGADTFRLMSAFDHAGGAGRTIEVRVLYSGRVHYDALEGGKQTR